MNVRQLEIFDAVMRQGAVTEAARVLGISQPAVTKSLRLLEESLGFALFRRVGGRLIPSSAAEVLLPEVERVQAAVQAVAGMAAQMRSGTAGRLEVAAASSLAEWLLPRAIAQLRRERPGVQVEMLTLNSAAVIEHVSNGRADFGLIHDPTDNAHVVSRDICDAAVVCAVARRHPLAKREALGPADLAATALIGYRDDTRIGGALRRAFRAAGLRRTPEVTTNSTRVAMGLVAAQVGIAVVDPFLAGIHAVPGVVTIPFRPTIPLRVRLIRSRERPQPPFALAFVRIVTALARQRAGE